MGGELGTVRWFGDSWGAPACDPRAHVGTPIGQPCAGHEHLHATRSALIEAGDQGVTLPYIPGPGAPIVRIAFHLNCWLHEVGA